MKQYHIEPYMNYAHNLREGSVREKSSGMIRTLLEKRGWLKRRMGICPHYPTMTISHHYPNHIFYYGYAHVFPALINSASEEHILGVAVYDADRKMVWFSYPKARHGEVLHVTAEYGSTDEERANFTQGFLTTKGRFVSRIQALEIAKRCSQLIRKTPPDYLLFSEDLFTGGLRSHLQVVQ